MRQVKISDIKLVNRYRKDYGDIEELAKSIKEIGLIQPIVVDSELRLLAGGRRYTACALLGMKTIPVVDMGELTETQRTEIEAEENIRRKNFTWQEEVTIIKKLVDIKRTINPDISIEELSKIVGVSHSQLSKDIAVASAMATIPELSESKDKTEAFTKLKRVRELNRRKVASDASDIPDTVKLYNGNCIDILKNISTEIVDLVLFDPPFGVNFQDSQNTDNYISTYGEYQDTIENYYSLLAQALPELYRVMKPGSHCYMFSSSSLPIINGTIPIINNSGLSLDPNPLFWIKPSNNNPSPYTKFTINYELIYLLWKGTDTRRPLLKSHNCTFHHSNNVGDDMRLHPAQKPSELYNELIEISTYVDELVLDPTAGSGISLVSALTMGRKAIGIEMDENYYKLMKFNVSKVI